VRDLNHVVGVDETLLRWQELTQEP
jgi:hypothetical protein